MSLDNIDIDSWGEAAPDPAPAKEEAPKERKKMDTTRQAKAPRQQGMDPRSCIDQALDAFNEIEISELATVILTSSTGLAGCKTVKGIVKRNGRNSLDAASLVFITGILKQLFKEHLERRMKGRMENV